jgi:hypothetical protein
MKGAGPLITGPGQYYFLNKIDLKKINRIVIPLVNPPDVTCLL